MLPDDHPAVQAELDRRSQVRQKALQKDLMEAKAKPKAGKSKRGRRTDGDETQTAKNKDKDKDDAVHDSGKWQLQHQQLAESRFLVFELVS